MVKEIARTIEIPEGVSVSLSQDVFTARGPKGTVERKFWYPGIKIEVREKESTGGCRILQERAESHGRNFYFSHQKPDHRRK